MTHPPTLLALLDEALSEEERRAVLAGALLSLDAAGLRALYGRLEEDTARVLRAVLDPGVATALTGGGRSANRIAQDWDEAWSDWDALIEESQDETGRFVEQEEHWHPPCFSSLELAQEMDEIGGRLLPLLDAVLECGIEPDFDLLARLELDLDAIGAGLPEWFGEPEIEGLLGPQLTACVLRWRWLDPAREGHAFGALDALRRREKNALRWGLEGGALEAFVQGLPEEEQRALFQDLQAHAGEPHWVPVLARSWSAWFRIYRGLARRWAPAAEAAVCRAAIASDGSLAIPVLEDLLEHGALDEAAQIVKTALAAYLDPRGEAGWEPLDSLLVDHRMLAWRGQLVEPVAHLLALAARVAEGTGDTGRARALESQAFLLRRWESWDDVLAHLHALKAGGHAATADRLLELWSGLVARRSIGRYGDGGTGSWVPLVVSALWHGSPSEAVAALGAWVERAGSSPDEFRRVRPQLGVLTRDLGLAGAAPALLRLLPDDSSPLTASRRQQLQAAGGPEVIPAILATWRRHAALLVLDPAHAQKSRYEEHAAWLAAVREIDPAVFTRTLAAWRQQHPRRRNLWAALVEAGIRGCP